MTQSLEFISVILTAISGGTGSDSDDLLLRTGQGVKAGGARQCSEAIQRIRQPSLAGLKCSHHPTDRAIGHKAN